MRKIEITKKHAGVLGLSYIVSCLLFLVLIQQQASATSYVPLPERKPYAEKAQDVIKVALPATKPQQKTSQNSDDPERMKFLDRVRRAINPSASQQASPIMPEEAAVLTAPTGDIEQTSKTIVETDIKTATEDELIVVFRPIPASEAPYPQKKPISDSKTLSQADALLYKQIFAHQAVARWEKADALIGTLSDYRLRGHILFQRYMHPTSYTTSFDELNGWMSAYADHPGAERIYKLALAKMPKDFKGHIRQPENKTYHAGLLSVLRDNSKNYHSPRKRSASEKTAIGKLQSSIRRDIAKGRPTQALKTLETSTATAMLDPVEHDRLKAMIANSYMLVGKLEEARPLALSAAERSGVKAPLAGWVGGLLAWRSHDYSLAASLFIQTAESPYSSSWTQAGGSYWASRAYMRAGKIQEVSPWLERAASHPRTFYGMIATKALGWDHDFNWNVPDLEQDHINTLAEEKAGFRAIALVAAGQHHLAEAELKNLNMRDKPEIGEALLAYTVHKELPSFALKIAETTPHPEGGLYDAALYPLSPWTAKDQSNVDKAIIHALIRQESRFNPVAESRSGATGLMQLMPRTASFISGNSKYRTREGQHSLKTPQINLAIGEKYIRTLLEQGAVDNELFSLAIAYNAGPGNLRKWKRELADISEDPLLFVESIPMSETRAFVERVMAFYWIYRMRLDQPTPSLQAVAEGAWPKYVMMDSKDSLQKAAYAKPQEPQRVASYQQ